MFIFCPSSINWAGFLFEISFLTLVSTIVLHHTIKIATALTALK
jgi:hypothetical protein